MPIFSVSGGRFRCPQSGGQYFYGGKMRSSYHCGTVRRFFCAAGMLPVLALLTLAAFTSCGNNADENKFIPKNYEPLSRENIQAPTTPIWTEMNTARTRSK